MTEIHMKKKRKTGKRRGWCLLTVERSISFVLVVLLLAYGVILHSLLSTRDGASRNVPDKTKTAAIIVPASGISGTRQTSRGGTSNFVNNRPPSLASQSESPPLLLNVPFYVYEDLLWLDEAVIMDSSNNSTPPVVITTAKDWILHRQEIKHSEDWWFAQAALRHPQRTLDPSRAKIFVVPALLNTVIDLLMNEYQRKAYGAKLCWRDLCGKQLLKYTNDFLDKSEWFQRSQGKDHFLVASHWRSDWHMVNYTNLYNCHVIGMEDRQSNHDDRLHFPSTYVGRPCPRSAIKKHDFAFVADLITPSPMFNNRRDLCQWMMEENNATTTTTTTTSPASTSFSMPFCGAGPQCPTLAEARYGFHVRGDTLGSNRLIDTILSGTVPIFTAWRQYKVLPDFIDWEKLSAFANIRDQDKNAFIKNVRKVLDDNTGYTNKLHHVLQNRDLIDWKTLVPFDLYMYVLSVQLWPQQERERRQQSNVATTSPYYSAFIFPRPGHVYQVPKKPGPLPKDRKKLPDGV